jgi:hypothetical protein
VNKHEAEIVLRHLRRLASLPSAQSASDRQLLERFLVHHEEAAFTALLAARASQASRCRAVPLAASGAPRP